MFLLKAFIALIILILLFVGCVYWSMQSSKKQAETDGIKQSELCDTIKVITEQPQIELSAFKGSEVEILRFYLQRGTAIVKDTTIRGKFNYVSDDKTYRTLNIPFNDFLKTDTIIVETNTKLYYKISGYHHYAYLHYGMFGYVGSSDCRLSESCTVNADSLSNGTLLKAEGLKLRPPVLK